MKKLLFKIIILIFCFSSLIFNVYLDIEYLDTSVIDIDISNFIFKEEDSENVSEVEKPSKSYINVKNNEIYKNKNYIGNLKIIGTDFKEPIYKYSDNDYYLTHDGRGNKKSSGATYMDYRVSKNSNKILIYGHNNDSLSLPFSILENYNDKDYYDEYKYLILDFVGEEYTYEIFSVYVETGNWDYMKINFLSSGEWLNHLNDLKERSFYDTGVSVSNDDDILILQTCSKNKDYSKYKRKYMLVIAKRVN